MSTALFSSDRLGVGVVGAGRVGTVLAAALAGAGHSLVGVSTISEANRERVEAMLPGVPVLEEQEVVRRAELVVFAVPGSELPGLVRGLTALGAWQPGQLVLHTAPQHGYGVFEPALAAGVIPLALTPGISFTGTSLDVARLAGVTAVVSAPKTVLPIAQALAVELGMEPTVVDDGLRPQFAAALTRAADVLREAVREAHAELTAVGVEVPSRLLGSKLTAELENELQRLRGAEPPAG